MTASLAISDARGFLHHAAGHYPVVDNDHRNHGDIGPENGFPGAGAQDF
ncbi:MULTISPECIES: hypothetical protein [Alphaproteobacteria]|nr:MULTISPECIES: hypothetical protein [Alphaproteobacteria]|tara:strand:- start:97 stop:243 length:147 start_codon:yes stop_codon:yes gene_type:complete